MFIPKKVCGIEIPLDIWHIIFFEFNPTPLHEYLRTKLNNFYAISFRRCIYPSCKYTQVLKYGNVNALLMFLIRLRSYFAPIKRYKSQRFLRVITYNEFPIIEKLLLKHKFSLFLYN